MKKLFISLITIIATPLAGYTQDSLKVLDALYSDFSVPDASAFSLLGITPDKVNRPTSAKEVSASLLNLAAGGNNISPGIAIEWAPGITFDRRFIFKDSVKKIYADFAHYSSYKSVLARNISLSLASVQDTTGSKFAIGISALLYDGSDYSRDSNYIQNIWHLVEAELDNNARIPQMVSDFRTNYSQPLLMRFGLDAGTNAAYWNSHLNFSSDTASGSLNKDTIKAAMIVAMPPHTAVSASDSLLLDELIEKYIAIENKIKLLNANDKASIQKAIAKAKDEFKKTHWNAGMVKIGLGHVWYSPNYKWSGLQAQKFSGYISLATRLPGDNWLHKHAQLVGLLQYGQNDNDSLSDKGQFSFGGRVLLGSNKVHGSFEVVYDKNTYKQTATEALKESTENYRSTVGVEFRMNDGLWVELATGVAGPPRDFWKNAGMLTFGSVKYTFKKESRYVIP